MQQILNMVAEYLAALLSPVMELHKLLREQMAALEMVRLSLPLEVTINIVLEAVAAVGMAEVLIVNIATLHLVIETIMVEVQDVFIPLQQHLIIPLAVY